MSHDDPDAFVDDNEDTQPNRRRYLRYADDSVRVRLRSPGMLGRLRPRLEKRPLIDYNRYGLAFLTELPVEGSADLLVDIDAGSLSVTGVPARIASSEQRDDGMRVGLEFRLDSLRPAAANRMAHQLHELERALKRR